MKVKKGDMVQMLSGKDRGKQGRIVDAQPRAGRVIVENLNQVTRHTKPRPMRDASRMGGSQMTPGGRIEKPAAGPDLERDARLPGVPAADAGGLHVQGGQGPRPAKVRVCKPRGLRAGDRLMATAADETYVPRLKQRYNDELRAVS